eukprot:g14481.t1
MDHWVAVGQKLTAEEHLAEDVKKVLVTRINESLRRLLDDITEDNWMYDPIDQGLSQSPGAGAGREAERGREKETEGAVMGCTSFKCCGQCCGLLSVFGIFFLFSVGSMFDTQPLFTDVEVWQEHHDHDAAVNCYIGGAIYLFTLAASIGCFMYDKKRSTRRPVIMATSTSTNLSYPSIIPGNFDSNGSESAIPLAP